MTFAAVILRFGTRTLGGVSAMRVALCPFEHHDQSALVRRGSRGLNVIRAHFTAVVATDSSRGGDWQCLCASSVRSSDRATPNDTFTKAPQLNAHTAV